MKKLSLRTIVGAQGDGVCSGEVFGDSLFDLSRDAPFRPSQEKRLEAHALHSGVVVQTLSTVAEHDVENPSLAILYGEDERFFASRASLLWRGIGCIEQILDAARSPHPVV